MAKHWILTFTLAAALLIQACSPQNNPPQTQCGFVMNTKSQRVSWGERVPVLMYADPTVPQAYYPAVQRAMARWNQVLGREVVKLVGSIGSFPNERQDGVNVIYFRSNWSESEQMRSKQAITTIHWAGSQIFEADLAVNTRHFRYSTAEAPSASEVDFESLMVHEIGHVLGLDHEDSQFTVMAEKLPGGVVRRDVPASDAQNLNCEYP